MKKFKILLKKLFCLSPLLTVCLSAFGFGFVLAVTVFDIQNPVLRYSSYAASAYALVITITGLCYVGPAVKKLKNFALNHRLTKKFNSTWFGEKYMNDLHFRSRVSLFTSFLINLIYIVIKLISGIRYKTLWFVALAVYYMLLAVMRFALVKQSDVCDKLSELRRYRLCGIMLLFMNQAVALIVIFMVNHNRQFSYPGVLIYAMAFYSFYAVITAIVNIVKTRKHKSPVLSAAKAINFVAALVSVLSLTTAMLAQFGGNDAPLFRKYMTGATGGSVCTIVIGMAIYMIYNANKNIKKLQN